jgi:hypothetical protein
VERRSGRHRGARHHTGLGRIDEALGWLEQSYLQDDIWLRVAWWDPLCAALRDEISKGTRVGDDNHAAGRLAQSIREVREALLAQPRAGLAFAFKIVHRVFQGHAVALQEPVEFVA